MNTIKEVITNLQLLGYSREAIIEKLREKGFTEAEIMTETATIETIPTQEEQKPKKNIWKILGYVGLGLLLIIKYGVKCRALYSE